MKKLLFVFVIVGMMIVFGCGKQVPDTNACTNKSIYADTSALLTYAKDSSIHVSWDSLGLYYQILDSGNNNKPLFSSNITVNYVGRLMSGFLFDSASNTNLNGNGLYKLLNGWQYGLPKIGVGGHIILLIPSANGYGCTGYGPVPPDAPLYYDVKLLQVN